jgi:hypothetical protein
MTHLRPCRRWVFALGEGPRVSPGDPPPMFCSGCFYDLRRLPSTVCPE